MEKVEIKKVVDGAIRNYLDAHPPDKGLAFNPESLSKRIVGQVYTLHSQKVVMKPEEDSENPSELTELLQTVLQTVSTEHTAEDFQEAPHPASLPVVKGVDGREIPLDKLLHIDPENVRIDFEHAATWQASISYAASVARLKLERKKREIKVTESRRFLALRDLLESKLGKPPSIDLVNHNVNIDPETSQLWEEYFALEEEFNRLESARFAIYARRELMISMGAEVRLDRKASLLDDRFEA